MFTRYDELTRLTRVETPRTDNKAMTCIYQRVAEYDLSVLLRCNIASKWERNSLCLAEVEELLRNNPYVRFIWALEIHRHQGRLEGPPADTGTPVR